MSWPGRKGRSNKQKDSQIEGQKGLSLLPMSETVTIQVFRRELLAQLSPIHGAEEANMLVRLLLEHCTGIPAFELVRDPSLGFPPNTLEQAQNGAARLLAHEPIQHITGIAHFYGREFIVSPDVLIPRRETEELVERVKSVELTVKSWGQKPVSILDVGTGSGCIAITLALELGHLPTQITGWDVSEAALAVARKNAANLGAQVAFRQGDILMANPDEFEGLDIIVSNPPYVTQSEKAELAPNVRDHEPGLALFVEDHDPLLFYRKIAQLGKSWLKPGGMLFFEINERFGQETIDLLESMGYGQVELRKDLGGKDRMVWGRNLSP